MVALDIGLEAVLLILASLALVFLARARKALTLKTVSRARIFLLFVVFAVLTDNALEIYFGYKLDADSIALETLVLALAGTALFYSGRARHERPRENLGVAVVCMVWTSMAAGLQLILGIILML